MVEMNQLFKKSSASKPTDSNIIGVPEEIDCSVANRVKDSLLTVYSSLLVIQH
jgi:hypothetical protein